MKEKLARFFELIDKAAFLPVFQGLTALEAWQSFTGNDSLQCPSCKNGKRKPVPVDVSGMMKPG